MRFFSSSVYLNRHIVKKMFIRLQVLQINSIWKHSEYSRKFISLCYVSISKYPFVRILSWHRSRRHRSKWIYKNKSHTSTESTHHIIQHLHFVPYILICIPFTFLRLELCRWERLGVERNGRRFSLRSRRSPASQSALLVNRV